MKRSLLKEIIIIVCISVFLGFTVNFFSPNKIPLVQDYSSRYIVDSTSSDKQKPVRQYTKEGFVKPVNVKVQDVKKMFDEGVVFIDGRPPEEFAAGHIKGAVNIPYKEFKDKTTEQKLEILKAYDKEKPLVSYCGGGDCEISIDNAYEMAKAGYNELKIYLGGYKEWEELGYPTEK